MDSQLAPATLIRAPTGAKATTMTKYLAIQKMRSNRIQRPLGIALVGLSTLLFTACGGGSGGGNPNVPEGPNPPGNLPLVVDFGLRTDLHLGSSFLGDMVHADVNGDGIEDLIESNFGTRFLTIALGNADGTFSTHLELKTVGHGFSVTTGDFNGDALVDIAVACGDHQSGAQQAVEVFVQGPGVVEFSGSATFAMSADPKEIVSGPMSGIPGSGGPDELYVAVRPERRVLRLSLDVGGNLVQTGEFNSANLGSAGGPFSLALIDLGADNMLDLVVGEEDVADGSPDRLVQFARTAAGFQAAELVYMPLYRPVVRHVGDVDNNGFDDLAVAQLEGTEVFLFGANASGLASGTLYPLDFGGETTSLLFTDLDGDGLAEAVGTVLYQNSIQVHKASAPLVYDEPTHYNVGVAPRAIGMIHLPGDSTPDLLCANAQDLSVLLGMGDARFRGAIGFTTGQGAPVFTEVVDLDNDGDLDTVSITNQQQALVIQEGLGDGTFVTRTSLPLALASENDIGFIELIDIDRNGYLDILVTVFAANELRVYRNYGDIGAFSSPLPADIHNVGSGPVGFDLADLNNDSKPDVILANMNDNSLELYLGAGQGELILTNTLNLGMSPVDLICSDFDNDGDLDAAVTASDASDNFHVIVIAGDGSGGLTIVNTYPVDGRTGDLGLGDFNEDGMIDIVVGQLELIHDSIFLFYNEGALGFRSEPVVVSPGPGTIVVADADYDGNLDLIIPTTEGELRMLFGDGAGAFPTMLPADRGAMPIPEDTTSASFGDLDGDFLPELILSSPRTPFTWVGYNTSFSIQN